MTICVLLFETSEYREVIGVYSTRALAEAAGAFDAMHCGIEERELDAAPHADAFILEVERKA